MTTSKRVVIFEGPDGSGKTTAAKAYAAAAGARYVHLGPFPTVTSGLPRIYAEAMLPAVLGYQSVVLDRSWISEPIYGMAFRRGLCRVDVAHARMLDRLALRCGGVLVQCLPAWATCRTNWEARKQQEMLTEEAQLHQVWNAYAAARDLVPASALPTVHYDYARWTERQLHEAIVYEQHAYPAHSLIAPTAGHSRAPVLIVGEDFAERKNVDPLYQWPFASFNGLGCSRWLTEQLEAGGIDEAKLLWANADMDLQALGEAGAFDQVKHAVALGNHADAALTELDVRHVGFLHPQAHARFKRRTAYPLIAHLKEILS